jgi:hypothetical protein
MLSLQKLATFVLVSEEPQAGRTDNSRVRSALRFAPGLEFVTLLKPSHPHILLVHLSLFLLALAAIPCGILISLRLLSV